MKSFQVDVLVLEAEPKIRSIVWYLQSDLVLLC